LTPADPDGPLAGQTLVSAPFPPDFPRGTVWECDCGTRWVSRGATDMTDGYTHWVDVVRWRREGWFARWRRLRKERRDA
jgi:hypothetical protein